MLSTYLANCLPSLYADHPAAFFNLDRPTTDDSHLLVNKTWGLCTLICKEKRKDKMRGDAEVYQNTEKHTNAQMCFWNNLSNVIWSKIISYGNLHSLTTLERHDYLFVADCYVRAHLKRKEKERKLIFVLGNE